MNLLKQNNICIVHKIWPIVYSKLDRSKEEKLIETSYKILRRQQAWLDDGCSSELKWTEEQGMRVLIGIMVAYAIDNACQTMSEGYTQDYTPV